MRREVSAADDASAHKDVTEATDSSSALDGAAALNSDVDGAAAEIKDPEGCCWCCQCPGRQPKCMQGLQEGEQHTWIFDCNALKVYNQKKKTLFPCCEILQNCPGVLLRGKVPE